MEQFTGYKAEKAATGKETLPTGGYIAKILDAKEIIYSWGKVLNISFDIIEGEHKDFFKNDYAVNTKEDKKWRGVYRLNEPKDDGTEQDGWTKNAFGNAMYAIEASNGGFHWSWDEKTLKGKTIGVLFRNFEWEMSGKNGWSTECGMLIPADDIRGEKYKPMKDRPLKNKAPSAATGSSLPEVDDSEDLPF